MLNFFSNLLASPSIIFSTVLMFSSGIYLQIFPNYKVILSFFNKEKTDEICLQQSGILNAHLYINAQTRIKHMECESSYTIICVSPHEKKKTVTGLYKKAEFDFNIHDDEAIVVPFDIGTGLVYSRFLLTHPQ